MPNLLTIPRELRDEIYKWGLLTPLSDQAPAAQNHRRRVGPKKERYHWAAGDDNELHPTAEHSSPLEDPAVGYIWGEEPVRYPEHTPFPPTHSLLATCSQLRNELKESVRRLGNGKIRYKIDIASLQDKTTLYPTWVSIPMFSKHIDVLDVTLRVRPSKTSSVCSLSGYEEREWEGDFFNGGLACLQRFLERGVHFLSKKKSEALTIGVLAINADAPPSYVRSDFLRGMEEAAVRLDEWMLGMERVVGENEVSKRDDEQFRLLAAKIERLTLAFCGQMVREWDLKETVRRRDELLMERERNVQLGLATDLYDV